jgi:alanine racemase
MIRMPRAVAYVDMGALEGNYRAIRAAASPGAKVLCVVKADAYGHGAVQTARRLEENDVDYLGVATIDEGMELRESGITAPVLVMSGIFPWDDVGAVFKHGLTPVVYDLATLDRIEEEGEQFDEALKVHLKVDTGMGRLGFSVDDCAYLAERVKEMKKVAVEGLMSHFSASETRNEYGMKQVELFRRALQSLNDGGVNPEIVHMANSGALTTYPEAHFSMVRAGINLYGSHAGKDLREKIALKQVMKFVSRVALLRDFQEGAPLSYGGTYTTKRNTRVAYVPVGYADGYPRMLSNKGFVLIHDKRCAIVGRICMDWLLADVTYLDDVEAGEEVIILGHGESQVITADEIAEITGTIPYEILCNISKRVMRVYV